jgi:hypothetical protein
MSATGQITTVGRGDWLIRLGDAISRWARRRLVRADLTDVHAGDQSAERRAQLEERMLLERELQAFEHQLARAKNLTAVYRGL